VLVLHDNPRSSNAQKVRFLLAELGLDYERRTVPFGEERPAWHVAVNPFGGIPALVDGELALAESQAILRYLAARSRRRDLHPTDVPSDAGRVDWLLDAVAGSLRPATRPIDAAALGWRSRRGIGAAPPDPSAVAAAVAAAGPAFGAFERLLGEPPYACLGRFTLADCAAAPLLHRVGAVPDALDGHPRLAAWRDAVLARPAWAEVARDAGV
jgi:glutathione S-transferase